MTSKDCRDVVIEAVSAEDPDADQSLDPSQSDSTAMDAEARVEPTEPIVEVVKLEQKVVKRTKNYVYRGWRVDVANTLDTNVEIYIEVEWLDADGFRVDYANESRVLAPGVNVISKVETFDQQENSNVSSFRVVRIQGETADRSDLGFARIKDKVTKRTKAYVYRSWRVDVVNNSDHMIDAYVEVEWLDKDGFRVDYANESRKLSPGVSVISKVETFDKLENSRIKSFRVVKLSGR
ncbi:hypothetical protein [Rubripirellula reticaptiva]|nr:hypothetical protein [Rubripirellula reticaptiva]